MENLKIKGKKYKLPMFLPDATRAVIKSVDSKDVEKAGVEGVVVNTYHLMTDPGVSVLKKFGGIKNFMKFEGLVTSDSGGWQIFSLIHRHKKAGSITDKGVTFSIGGAKKKLFSPEKSIQVQFDIGSDIIVCLDDFTPPESSKEQIRQSVERTIKWAELSKKEYEEQLRKREISDKNRPLLLAVIQGDLNKKFRKQCAEELINIGFDGYGYGGYPLNKEGKIDLEMSGYVADLIPNNKIKFALGVGFPWEIVKFYEQGWNVFDCTLPTRDARHKRMYIFNKNPKDLETLKNPEAHGHLHIHREKYRRDERPISKYCDCYTCENFSRAYLHHLFNIEDFAALRLATIHNLRTYTKLIEVLRNSS